jgi:hypothetical protein
LKEPDMALSRQILIRGKNGNKSAGSIPPKIDFHKKRTVVFQDGSPFFMSRSSCRPPILMFLIHPYRVPVTGVFFCYANIKGKSEI